MSDDFPRVMTLFEIRLMIAFEIGQVPRGLVQQWLGKDRLKGAAARERIVDRIARRFEGLQVRCGPPLAAHSVPPAAPSWPRDDG